MLLVGRPRDGITVVSVTGIFLVDTDRTMCSGVNSASKKWVPGIPLGIKAAGGWGWRPTTLVVPNVKKSGALTYPDPIGPSRLPVVGETFTFTLPSSSVTCFWVELFKFYLPFKGQLLLYVPSVITFKILRFFIPCFRQSDSPGVQWAVKRERAAAASFRTTANVLWICYRIPVPCWRYTGTLLVEGVRGF